MSMMPYPHAVEAEEEFDFFRADESSMDFHEPLAVEFSRIRAKLIER